jgi:hypothetical protein
MSDALTPLLIDRRDAGANLALQPRRYAYHSGDAGSSFGRRRSLRAYELATLVGVNAAPFLANHE